MGSYIQYFNEVFAQLRTITVTNKDVPLTTIIVHFFWYRYELSLTMGEPFYATMVLAEFGEVASMCSLPLLIYAVRSLACSVGMYYLQRYPIF